MKHALRIASRLLVILVVACAVLATGGDSHWLVLAAGISIYVVVGWLLWTTRGTFHNVFLVALFFPILPPVALLDWMRRRMARPQPD